MTDITLESAKEARLPALRLPVVPIGSLLRALANTFAAYSIAKTDAYGVAMGINRQPRREEENY